MVIDNQVYKSSYNGQILEDLGIFITSHDAFKLPKITTGVFEAELGAGGKRLYSNYQSKQINITLAVDNGSTPEANIRTAVGLFTQPGLLLLEERPDRVLYCRLDSGITLKDKQGYTEIQFYLAADYPFFLGLENKTFTGPGVLVLPGNTVHHPTIVLEGPVNDPYITIVNQTGSFSRLYEGLSLGSGDQLSVDLLHNVELVGQQSVSALSTYSLLVLSPGSNTVDSNAPGLTIYYRDTYL